MEIGENCRDLKAELGKATENLCDLGIPCHICHHIFEKGQEIYVHKIESLVFRGYRNTFPVCHKKCRDGLPKPEPTPEESEKRYDANDESSDRQRFEDERAEREFTIYGQPKWNDYDDSMLEEMWKEGKSIEEIANRLDRTEGAIEHRIRTEKIVEKTGRCLPPSAAQLRYLKSLGYQEIPTCRKEAMEKIEEMLNKPTSTTFEAELRATGYTGSIPKTNQETLDAIWERQDPTENQINLLKRICAALGKEFEMPLNKLEASKTIDLLKQEASSKQIRIPTRDGRSKLKKMDSVQDDEENCPDCDGLSALKDSTIDCESCRNLGTLEAYEHVKSLKFKCPKCEGAGCSRCVYTGAREDYDAFEDYANESSDPADDVVDYEEDYDDEE